MTEKQANSDDWLQLRQRMVENQIRNRGVNDQRVLEAMRRIPRERFVPVESRSAAYADRAVYVGQGQTISQPYIVAYMSQKLNPTPDCRVLEVGTGTGYQTAILALLCKHVYTIERISSLQRNARKVLAQLEINNVSMFVGDGTIGLEEQAPFDRILVTAAGPKIPQALIEQLEHGGRLVIPVGGKSEQRIVAVTRKGPQVTETPLLPCRFVRLVGQEGWAPNQEEKQDQKTE
ncbi:MAG: protein-L-isoaspartate(D-aspartate) O-methyltransferase [Phycisphaerales bacterium]|nr:MAG: protein-L-isoaspartate(D-aspartate) O-methyltransferase [Phycisphaerales bacterium]